MPLLTFKSIGMNLQKLLIIIIISFSGILKGNSVGNNTGGSTCIQDSLSGNAVIDVEYKPNDKSGIIWKDELELARIIPTLDGNGIRITLPNSDPAKLIILDKKGKKTLKKISYVAPAIIDISDLKKGSYQLILESHNVVVIKTFLKSRR